MFPSVEGAAEVVYCCWRNCTGGRNEGEHRFGLLFISLVFAGQALAQQGSSDQLWTELKKLDWKFGPAQGDVAGVANIVVPKSSVFLGAAGTRRFLELNGNLTTDNSYTFAPSNLSWFSVFNFDPSGYVKDDETLDPDELLSILQKNNASANEERTRRGLETLVLEGWYVAPHYDVQTKRLEWATKLRNPSGVIVVNYTIRLLGRSGVMNAVLVSNPGNLDNDIKAFKGSLASFSFNAGQRYSEFRAGDKVAEYGLAALIVGGAAAAAAKSGVIKSFGKLIIFGVFGGLATAWAAIKRMFSRKQA